MKKNETNETPYDFDPFMDSVSLRAIGGVRIIRIVSA